MFYLSLFLIVGVGAGLFYLAKLIHIPQLVLYLIWGIVISAFSLLDPSIQAISSYIRKIALIIILVKAGLSLDISDLKKVGRPAILMSFLPACTEMVTVGLVAPLLFNISYVESFLLGSVLGAVSPAVVIPMMSRLMDEKRGTAKGIPQLIIAGSSIDDIIMIVFYQVFLTMEQGGKVTAMMFLNIPISIVSGVGVGLLIGFLVAFLFAKVKIRNLMKIVIILGIAFLFTYFESLVSSLFTFSSLLAIITMCIIIKKKDGTVAKEMANGYNKIWSVAEMFLFILVGACIKFTSAEELLSVLLPALLILLCSLTMRSTAVLTSLIKTPLNRKERVFTVISYLPKATVQAAIGGGLLDLGNQMLSAGTENAANVIAAGNIVLSVSVLAILITAPLASIVMNLVYPKLLSDDSLQSERS